MTVTEHVATPDQPLDPELRFGFGKNWQKFLNLLNDHRIEQAQASLLEFWPKEVERPAFLDAGSGSGTFSLAARKLGARVVSFDFDPNSVACTQQLRKQFFPDENDWRIEQGSVLDHSFLARLGTFDIVYSWGVLHHTGAMWLGMENLISNVKPGGLLVVALYNDQGRKSDFWRTVKRIYCSGTFGRWLITGVFVPLFLAAFFVNDLRRFRNPFARYRSAHDARGMSVVTDIIDWIGGYPFEVAKPHQVREFYKNHGFDLVEQKLTRSLGCNEFVFRRQQDKTAPTSWI